MLNDSSSDTPQAKVKTTWQSLQRLFHLYIDSAKLTVSEKLTVLISAGVILIITLTLGMFSLMFFCCSLVDVLSLVLPQAAADAILGGFFLLLILLLVLLRKPLVINPIARFISKLILESGCDDTPNN